MEQEKPESRVSGCLLIQGLLGWAFFILAAIFLATMFFVD